jgi:hypothetical protein
MGSEWLAHGVAPGLVAGKEKGEVRKPVRREVRTRLGTPWLALSCCLVRSEPEFLGNLSPTRSLVSGVL